MDHTNGATGQFQHMAAGVYGYSTSTPPPPPPKPSSGSQTPSRGPPLPPAPSQGATYDASSGVGQWQQQAPAYPQAAPPESGWLPAGLADRSTQDLQHLLEHPELQAALLDNPETSHASIAQSQAPLRQLLEANIAISDTLAQLQSQLVAQRAATQSRLLGLRALEQQHRARITETENELKPFSPMALYQRLNASAQEQDLLIRGLEDSFVDENGVASDREVQDFVRRVREAKKVAFLRNERKLRWDEGRVGGWR